MNITHPPKKNPESQTNTSPENDQCAWVNMGHFQDHLDPDIRKEASRLERKLSEKILFGLSQSLFE